MTPTSDNTTVDMNSAKVFMDLYGIKAATVAEKIGMSKAGFANIFNPNQTSSNFTKAQKQRMKSYLLDMQKDLQRLLDKPGE